GNVLPDEVEFRFLPVHEGVSVEAGEHERERIERIGLGFGEGVQLPESSLRPRDRVGDGYPVAKLREVQPRAGLELEIGLPVLRADDYVFDPGITLEVGERTALHPVIIALGEDVGHCPVSYCIAGAGWSSAV